MIKAKDIDNMVRWAVDTDGFKFSEEMYNRENPDEYTSGKFRDMQTNFIRWIAGLDSRNRERLANNITKGE